MDEAIRLTRQLASLLEHTEASGLLALMLFQASRRKARVSTTGRLLTLAEQDRRLWNREQIEEADALLRTLLPRRDLGAYTLQAAIAGLHADASNYSQTNWREIIAFYDLLLTLHHTPVVALNRAVAVAKVDGPEQALQLVQQLNQNGDLENYRLFHVCCADFKRQLNDTAGAQRDYERALELTGQTSEREYLQEQLCYLNS